MTFWRLNRGVSLRMARLAFAGWKSGSCGMQRMWCACHIKSKRKHRPQQLQPRRNHLRASCRRILLWLSGGEEWSGRVWVGSGTQMRACWGCLWYQRNGLSGESRPRHRAAKRHRRQLLVAAIGWLGRIPAGFQQHRSIHQNLLRPNYSDGHYTTNAVSWHARPRRVVSIGECGVFASHTSLTK